VVSHELRTPLTAIRGYLEIVLGGEPGPLTPEQQRCLEIVDASCKQLLRVVSDLLLIGKSEAGQLALEIAEVDLRALLAECVVAAKPSADAKLIELRLADESAIEPIAGDYGRLSQAVANIISNAIKFTEVGHVDVRLLAEPERAVVEIADTGVGVPATEVDHLFVPFFRASTATREAIPGAGLGLSIAKEIIDAHGGRISLETQEGSGTSIRVELPMAVAG
jgi:signal transduction histidine kinase